ncbi:MAG: hypothetical protein JWM80_98 [Cyanobacteria bacterium RYN_339]|nr:hypothetical protein [Cyanobacteria bacterium RYN_339]
MLVNNRSTALPVNPRPVIVASPLPAQAVAQPAAQPVAPPVQALQPSLLSRIWSGIGSLFHQGLALLLGAQLTQVKTRQLLEDPGDVNDPTAADVATARSTLARLAAPEQAALARLAPAARQQFQGLAKAVNDRPLARQALQQLLLDDRLTTPLLGNLSTLATAPLAPGIDRPALLAEVVAECQNPVRINQHEVGTCGATTAQIVLARQDAAEYVRLVAGLASPQGTVKARGGATLRRQDSWAAPADGGRSTPSRLLQPALMDLGALIPLNHYSNAEDREKLGPIGLWGGLLGDGEARVLRQITGANYENLTFFAWNRNGNWEKLKQAAASGRGPVPLQLAWGPNGNAHFVQIDSVAGGKVVFVNPHGLREQMDEAEFKAHILQAQLPTAAPRMMLA